MKKSFWSWPGGWGGYVVAGAIFYYAQKYNKSVIDGVIIMVIAVWCGFLYYRQKSKSKIKNETMKVIITFILLLIFGMILIGLSTGLADRLFWQADYYN